jgi:hypothetical protein
MIQGEVSFEVRVPAFSRDFKYKHLDVITTKLRQIEFNICEGLGLDPMSTQLVLVKDHSFHPLESTLNLFLNDIKHHDVLYAYVKSTSKDLGRLDASAISEYVSGKQVAHHYPPARAPANGLYFEGVCGNERCSAKGKRVLITMGEGHFRFSQLVDELVCPVCASRDRNNSTVYHIKSMNLSACYWKYSGIYRDHRGVTVTERTPKWQRSWE